MYLLLRQDISKIKSETGWEPQIPFEQTIKEILGYWLQNDRRRGK